jgi:hypothetical protein
MTAHPPNSTREASVPTEPSGPPVTAPTSPLLAHFWKGFALLVVGLAVWGGHELAHAQRTVGIYHNGIGPPPKEGSPSLSAFASLGEQSEPAVVTLKSGSQVRGYYFTADEVFVVLRASFPKPKATETILVPWENVASIHRTDTARK